MASRQASKVHAFAGASTNLAEWGLFSASYGVSPRQLVSAGSDLLTSSNMLSPRCLRHTIFLLQILHHFFSRVLSNDSFMNRMVDRSFATMDPIKHSRVAYELMM